MPPRWSLVVMFGIALFVLVTAAWAHEPRPLLGGSFGVGSAIVALVYRRKADERANYLRGYEDGRTDAAGWGCRRG